MNRRVLGHLLLPITTFLLYGCPTPAASDDLPSTSTASPNLAKASNIICEAEEFTSDSRGWTRRSWGDNYFCSTFANCFLSRKAYLSAAPNVSGAVATQNIVIPDEGKYSVLCRYEAPYRFDCFFTIKIKQHNQVCFEHKYGRHESPKIWAFRGPSDRDPIPEKRYPWGSSEKIVWEGQDAFAKLGAGPAEIELVADKPQGLAASRNVDLVMLSPNQDEIEHRIKTESYLPLDGLLDQSGDLDLTIENLSKTPLKVTIPPGKEHSPYYVHQRTWKPIETLLAPGEKRNLEVGHLLDSLNDGDWHLKFSESPNYKLTFSTQGKKIATYRSKLTEFVLAFDADTRYSKRIRTQAEALNQMTDQIRAKLPQEVRYPKLFKAYGYTPSPRPEDSDYSEARERFLKIFPLTERKPSNGYMDVRNQSSSQALVSYLLSKKPELPADSPILLSLGDEIVLPLPPNGEDKTFSTWLDNHAPSDVSPQTVKNYWIKRYNNQYGIKRLQEVTETVRRIFPNADVGANFSPHHAPYYLGSTAQWLTLFREGGLNAPWSEDYIWQIPVGSQMMSAITLDLGRAAVRGKKRYRIVRYVMPHSPGNTPNSWRRQFYSALMHGMTELDLFEFRPLFTANTENYVNSADMFIEVARTLDEVANIENIWIGAKPSSGDVALWWGEAADIWNDDGAPFATGKRCLYVMLRHLHQDVEPITSDDNLTPYKVIILTEQHVTIQDSQKLKTWVEKGGHLILTAGAGTKDEADRPNNTLTELAGLSSVKLRNSENVIDFAKQDLPYAAAMARTKSGRFVYGTVADISVDAKCQVLETFDNGSPAVVERSFGHGRTTMYAYLPGLTYFHDAIPKRPVDRGAKDNSMAHFLPQDFDTAALQELDSHLKESRSAVSCSEPLVEASVLQGPNGVVVPLVNWSQTAKTVMIRLENPPSGTPRMASGQALKILSPNVFEFRLNIADALVIPRREP